MLSEVHTGNSLSLFVRDKAETLDVQSVVTNKEVRSIWYEGGTLENLISTARTG
jgi:hypothetical protein